MQHFHLSPPRVGHVHHYCVKVFQSNKLIELLLCSVSETAEASRPQLLLSSQGLNSLGTERNSLQTQQTFRLCVIYLFLLYPQEDDDVPLFTLKQRH